MSEVHNWQAMILNANTSTTCVTVENVQIKVKAALLICCLFTLMSDLSLKTVRFNLKSRVGLDSDWTCERLPFFDCFSQSQGTTVVEGPHLEKGKKGKNRA